MNAIRKIGRFYVDGFKEMTIGKTLWVIILCKVFVLFFVLRLFFFPNRLKALPDYEAKGAFVATDLVHRASDGLVGSAQVKATSSTATLTDPTSAPIATSAAVPAPTAAPPVGSPETLITH
ncbi:MAG: DUF4492 domain-containing protein [Bacteroidales bacterium]|nr:DUF4492 domain-containing protein [Bacteroidales bacterium]